MSVVAILSAPLASRTEIPLDSQPLMTHGCAPIDLIAEHAPKVGTPVHSLRCPICESRCRINASEGYHIARGDKSYEIPSETGTAVVASPDTQSRGVMIPLLCEQGHPFQLWVMQLFTSEAVHLDVVVSDALYEEHPERLFKPVVAEVTP